MTCVTFLTAPSWDANSSRKNNPQPLRVVRGRASKREWTRARQRICRWAPQLWINVVRTTIVPGASILTKSYVAHNLYAMFWEQPRFRKYDTDMTMYIIIRHPSFLVLPSLTFILFRLHHLLLLIILRLLLVLRLTPSFLLLVVRRVVWFSPPSAAAYSPGHSSCLPSPGSQQLRIHAKGPVPQLWSNDCHFSFDNCPTIEWGLWFDVGRHFRCLNSYKFHRDIDLSMVFVGLFWLGPRYAIFS